MKVKERKKERTNKQKTYPNCIIADCEFSHSLPAGQNAKFSQQLYK